MISLEEQQIIASRKTNQPLDIVKRAGFVDEQSKVFCIWVVFDKEGNLLYGEQIKGYKGGYVLLVGQDGGVLTGGSWNSVDQLIDMYIEGKRAN